MFANPSGVAELDPNLTINSVTETPVFRYKGGDADGTEITPWGYGETLDLQAGTVPTYNDGSPGLGAFDDSVKFNNGGYYKADNVNFGQITTEDFVIEVVFKYDAATTDAIAGTRDTGNGWSLYTTGQLKLAIEDAHPEIIIQSDNLIDGTWYHGIIFLDRSGSAQWYLNGVASAGALDISGEAGTLVSGLAMCVGARGAGTLVYNSNVAYVAMWKGAAWLDTHLQGTVAAERFAKWEGIYPQKANGTAMPSVSTRAYPAYLDKQEGAVRKLYYMAPEHMRMCSRDDVNGVNVKGYLSEPAIENLFDASEGFSGWTKIDAGDTVTDDAAVCPDGRTAAASLVADSTNGDHGVRKDPTLTVATHAHDVFARPGNQDWIALYDTSLAQVFCYFDIANGTIGTAGANATGYIEGPFFGGFYRCCIVFTGTVAAHALRVYTAVSDGVTTFAGDGVTVNTYLWGAQCEANDYMSSPIVTDGATATRLADSLRFVGDDGNITNNRKGSLVCNILYPDYDLAALKYMWSLNDGGAAADRIFGHVQASDNFRVGTRATAGNNGDGQTAGNIIDNVKHSVRARWAIDNLIASNNGVDGAADIDCGMPNDLDRIEIGRNVLFAGHAGCLISDLRIFDEPTRRG